MPAGSERPIDTRKRPRRVVYVEDNRSTWTSRDTELFLGVAFAIFYGIYKLFKYIFTAISKAFANDSSSDASGDLKSSGTAVSNNDSATADNVQPRSDYSLVPKYSTSDLTADRLMDRLSKPPLEIAREFGFLYSDHNYSQPLVDMSAFGRGIINLTKSSGDSSLDELIKSSKIISSTKEELVAHIKRKEGHDLAAFVQSNSGNAKSDEDLARLAGYVAISDDYKEVADIGAYKAQLERIKCSASESATDTDPIQFIKSYHLDLSYYDTVDALKIEDKEPLVTIDDFLALTSASPIQAARDLGFTYKLKGHPFPFVQLHRFRAALIELMKKPENRKHNANILSGWLLENDTVKLNSCYPAITGQELKRFIIDKYDDRLINDTPSEIWRLALLSSHLRLDSNLEESVDVTGFQESVRKIVH